MCSAQATDASRLAQTGPFIHESAKITKRDKCPMCGVGCVITAFFKISDHTSHAPHLISHIYTCNFRVGELTFIGEANSIERLNENEQKINMLWEVATCGFIQTK